MNRSIFFSFHFLIGSLLFWTPCLLLFQQPFHQTAIAAIAETKCCEFPITINPQIEDSLFSNNPQRSALIPVKALFNNNSLIQKLERNKIAQSQEILQEIKPDFMLAHQQNPSKESLPKKQQGAEPSATSIETLKSQFQKERDQAIQDHFPDQMFQEADQKAKRAELFFKKKLYSEAAKLYRDARWEIPYWPGKRPEHVSGFLGQNRLHHGDSIRSICFDPSGNRIVSASKDGTVKIWDLANGHELIRYAGHLENVDPDQRIFGVTSITWSSNGKWIASGDYHSIHIWDPETGIRKHLIPTTNLVGCLSSDPNKPQFVSGDDNGNVQIWDFDTGKIVINITEPKKEKDDDDDQDNTKVLPSVYAVRYSPDGHYVAALNRNGIFQTWFIKPDNTAILKLKTPVLSKAGYALAYTSNSESVIIAGLDSKMVQLSAPPANGDENSKPSTGSREHTFELMKDEQNSLITSLVITPDNKYLITGSRDKTIRIWDISSGKEIRILRGHNDEINSLVLSPDGKLLASASTDQTVRLWNLELLDNHQIIRENKGAIWTICTGKPDLIGFAGLDRIIRVYDRELLEFRASLSGHTAAITSILFSADGKEIYSASGDKTIRQWDIASQQMKKSFQGHASVVLSIDLSLDQSTLISGSADRTVKIWNTQSGELMHTFPDLGSAVITVALRADKKIALAGCANGKLFVLDLEQKKVLLSTSTHLSGTSCAIFHPVTNQIATCGGDKQIKIWNLENTSMKMIKEIRGHDKPLSSICYSSDGHYLASAGGDRIIKIWDCSKDYSEFRAIRGHTDWVTSVAFNPTNQVLISGSVDQTVRIWDFKLTETTITSGHTRAINSLSTSPDGHLLVSGSDDHHILVWDLDKGKVLENLTSHQKAVTTLSVDWQQKKIFSAGEDDEIQESIFTGSSTANNKIPSGKNPPLYKSKDTIAYLYFPPKSNFLSIWTEPKKFSVEVPYQKFNSNGASKALLLDLKTKSVDGISEPIGKLSALAFNTSGTQVLMGYKNGKVQLWDLKTKGKIGGEIPASKKSIGDLALTLDGQGMITIDIDCEIKIWNLSNQEVLHTIQGHKNTQLTSMAMSNNGTRFATLTQNGEVALWEKSTGRELRRWSLPSIPRTMCFTADGKKIITGNSDSTIYFLDCP